MFARVLRLLSLSMKNTSLMIITGLALMACAPKEAPVETATPTPVDSSLAGAPEAAAPPEAAPPAAGLPPEDACNVAQYAALVGKPATDPAVPAASPGVRHIRPDTQVTMDFRPDRLNVDINADGVITGFRCG